MDRAAKEKIPQEGQPCKEQDMRKRASRKWTAPRLRRISTSKGTEGEDVPRRRTLSCIDEYRDDVVIRDGYLDVN